MHNPIITSAYGSHDIKGLRAKFEHVNDINEHSPRVKRKTGILNEDIKETNNAK
jgi:hypothetical protein